jgi:hypothetical protein
MAYFLRVIMYGPWNNIKDQHIKISNILFIFLGGINHDRNNQPTCRKNF